MKKLLSLLSTSILVTSITVPAVNNHFKNENVIKNSYENGHVNLQIKNWETDSITARGSAIHKRTSTTKLSNKIFTGTDYDTYYFETTTKKIGDGWSEGSHMGYQTSDLNSEFWGGKIEIKAGEKKNEWIGYGFYKDDNNRTIGTNKLYLNLDYTDKNNIIYELENENMANVFILFGWEKTGATYNFDFKLSW